MNRLRRIGLAGLAVALLSQAHAGAWLRPGPRSSAPEVCAAIDPATLNAISPTNLFAPGTPLLYGVVEVRGVRRETRLGFEWVRQTEGGEEVVARGEVALGGECRAAFPARAPTDGWPRGTFALRILVDNAPVSATPFGIEGPDPQPLLHDAVLCESLDPFRMTPLNPRTVFPPTAPQICCSARLDFSPGVVEMSAQLLRLIPDADDEEHLTRTFLRADGGRRVGFRFTPRGDTWDEGRYEIRLGVEELPTQSIFFTVSSSPTEPASTPSPSVEGPRIVPLEPQSFRPWRYAIGVAAVLSVLAFAFRLARK